MTEVKVQYCGLVFRVEGGHTPAADREEQGEFEVRRVALLSREGEAVHLPREVLEVFGPSNTRTAWELLGDLAADAADAADAEEKQ